MLSSPYIKLIENIGAAFEAMGDTERAQYFFRTAESKNPVDEDVIWKIFKNAKEVVEIAPKSNHDSDERDQ